MCRADARTRNCKLEIGTPEDLAYIQSNYNLNHQFNVGLKKQLQFSCLNLKNTPSPKKQTHLIVKP